VHHLLSVAGTVGQGYGIARRGASVLSAVGEERYERLEAVFGRVCESVACTPGRRRTLEEVVELAVEIAREGREGRKIGTLFVVGDTGSVLARSRPLILDPLHGHPRELLHMSRPEFRETVKELAQLDGGFLVEDDGTVVSAARFVDVDISVPDVFLPGLGTRHAAGASISAATSAVAVVVSQSSMVRVFARGRVRAEIIPELFLLSRERLYAADAEVEELPDAGITLAVSAAP
jgi:diadenylate cyclase